MSILKNYRTKRHLTMSQLADKMKVSRQTIYNWETHKFTPTIDDCDRLSRILKVNVCTIVRDYINKEEK